MGYNRKNFKRIKEEYSTKHLVAERAAEKRKRELWLKLPELEAIDKRLAAMGARLMETALSMSRDREARLAQIRQETEELNRQRDALLEKNGYKKDYTDVVYECQKCGDSGYVGIQMCDCMKKALVMAGYESSGIARLLEEQTFESFSLDYYKSSPDAFSLMSRIYQFAKSYADGFKAFESESLFMLGGTGLGKTHLSSAVARKVIDGGNDVCYVTSVGMVSDFEAEQFDSRNIKKGELTDKYFDCDLLIIDDLGTEMTNQFTVSCLYNLLNVRINRRQATIINTNLEQSELMSRYSERITSRILGEFRVLPFKGEDIRRQKIRK